MNPIVSKILKENLSLNFEEAQKLIHLIMEEEVNETQITALMVTIQMRGFTLNEIQGFRQSLLELVIPIQIDGSQAIDLCGTGGDGKNTFNISTTSSFVLAAMGYKVIKHGNYGVSSGCGSSNVLEALGYVFTTNEIELQHQLDTQNICFLHAPLFHPALKKVGKIRKDLGIKSFFNSLGPLINPAQPAYQLTGTFSLELAKIYQYVLKNNRKQYRIIYGLDGYDEITLTDGAKVLGNNTDELISAESFHLQRVEPHQIHSGESIASATKMLIQITKGEGTNAQNQVVAANVAVALQCFHPTVSVKNLYDEALQFIKSGETYKQFKF